jgi:putative transposase
MPVKEPWRNGIIEKFNDTYAKWFLRKITFSSFEHLFKKPILFNEFHNSNHRYSLQQHNTPNEASKLLGERTRHNGNIHNQQKIPLETGVVYFIRFIRSDLKLRIATESF